MIAPTVRPDTLAALYEQVMEVSRDLQQTSGDVPSTAVGLIDHAAETFGAPSPDGVLSGIDPYLGQALLAAVLYCDKSLRDEDLDQRRRHLRLGVERMRQTLRDIQDEAPAGELQPAKDVARWLAHTVNVPQSQLAGLLDVAPRTWQRWVSETEPTEPEGDYETRVRAVARVVAHLRHAFTAPGVIRWFERPHPMLDGKPPKSLLYDATELPRLTRLASRSRSMVAS